MKYFILFADEGAGWDEMSPEEQQGVMERFEEFDRQCGERDGVAIVGGEALDAGNTSTTLRTSPTGEITITDGPFAEAAEQIGGFYVLEAPDLDTVIELCTFLPPYAIDIRPVVEYG